MFSMTQTRDLLGWAILDQGPPFQQTHKKDHKAILHTEFQAPESSGSEVGIFFTIFMYFYESNPGPLA